MNPVLERAEHALIEHDHPALRIRELVQLIADRVDRNLDARRLRSALETLPERFRLIDPWRGAWAPLRPGGPEAEAGEVWVVIVRRPGERIGGRTGTLGRLRETVRWLAQGIDTRSSADVTRWHAIAIAEREARAVVERLAA